MADPKDFTIVVAAASNGVIGAAGKIPWKCPGDLRHFKHATSGGALIMGRKTWESLPKALPDRYHVVLSRTPGVPPYKPAGQGCAEFLERAPDFSTALEHAAIERPGKVFVVGGAAVYAEALRHPNARVLYLTHIVAYPTGDVILEDHLSLTGLGWRPICEWRYPVDWEHPYAWTLSRWERRAERAPSARQAGQWEPPAARTNDDPDAQGLAP